MSDFELTESLKFLDHSLERRERVAGMVLDQPLLLLPLIKITLKNTFPESVKASWVLDVLARKHLELLLPHLDLLLGNLHRVTLGSAVRPLAKICESLALAFFQKNDPAMLRSITHKHLELMATACFDWLIGKQKVAVKAYAMSALYHLGKKFTWIHPELKEILGKDFQHNSAAYRAKARHILVKLTRENRSQ